MPKKYSDLSVPERHQKIYNILRLQSSADYALTITDVFEALKKEGIKVSWKTVERDLDRMVITHKLLVTDDKPKSYYSEYNYKPDYQLTLTDSELKTIALALSALREMSDPFQRNLCAKTEAIFQGKLPSNVARDFEGLKSLTIVTPAFRAEAGVGNSEAYKKVLDALKRGLVIKCENHSPYKDEDYHSVQRTFSPLKLNMVGSEQYLIIQDHEDMEIKRVKLCRLHNVTILDQKIDKSLLTKVDNLKASIGGFGGPGVPVQKYVIHCDRLMATLFKEKKIHSSQEITESDGKYTITFEANPSVEIVRHLAGWAKHIHAVEPMDVLLEMQEIWEAGNLLYTKKIAA